jgi:hypothetical protein
MALSINNIGKPSHKKWKLVADYLLYVALPAITVFFAALQPVSVEFSLWGVAISTLLASLFKGFVKLTIDPNYLIREDEFADKE